MTDKTISVYWFFILFIVASAIVFLVYTIYGAPLDIRGAEGVFLNEKIASCVSQGGKITSAGKKFISEGESSNLLGLCHLNFKVEPFKESWNNDQLFVSVVFSTVEGSVLTPGLPILAGNANLKSNCNINVLDSKTNQFPVCINRTMLSNGEDGKYYSIQIFTCVRKTEKNV
jgi:hypothetical protein